MKGNNLNFSSKLFLSLSLTAAFIIATMSIIFFLYVSDNIRKNSETTLLNVVENVASQMEYLIREMDAISSQIVYNQEIQMIMINASNDKSGNGNYFDYNYDEGTRIRYNLMSINSPRMIARRILLWNDLCDFVTVGSVMSDENLLMHKAADKTLPQELQLLHGRAMITVPHQDPVAPANTPDEVFSLARALTASYGAFEHIGYTEVQQPYSRITDVCESNGVTENVVIIVMNEASELFYPLSSELLPRGIHEALRLNKNNQLNDVVLTEFQAAETEEKYFYCSKTVERSSLTVYGLILKKDFQLPVSTVIYLILITTFLLIGIMLIAFYLLTKSLTKPIVELADSVKQISLQTPALNIVTDQKHDEIHSLSLAFSSMLIRIQESVNQLLYEKTSKSKAQMMALQAQMNPHFLYNTLMSISGLASESNAQNVVEICSTLANMMRYSGSFIDQTATIADEFSHTESYLSLIKVRYEDRLIYQTEIGDGMREIPMPKLILQPIVENCFSHGFESKRPPWRVDVISFLVNASVWNIEISDNGNGFPEEVKQRVYSQIEMIKGSSVDDWISDIEIGGMALVNVFIRLWLKYRENAVFRIDDSESGGARIVIGGRVQDLINSGECND